MRTLFVGALLCTATFSLAADDSKAQPKDDKREVEKGPLQVKQTGKTGWYLRVSVPKKSQPDDRLVLVYVADQTIKDPAEVILTPEGQVDKAVEGIKALARDFGDISINQANRFNNGTFDFWAEKNTHAKRGVYAVGAVSRKGVPIGVCVTYFSLSDWAADQEGDVEVPLPASPPGAREESIPRTCDLSVWLTTKSGQRVAEGKVKVVRK